jgi:hypothetical protein
MSVVTMRQLLDRGVPSQPRTGPRPDPVAQRRAADFAHGAAGISFPGPAAPVRAPRPDGVAARRPGSGPHPDRSPPCQGLVRRTQP